MKMSEVTLDSGTENGGRIALAQTHTPLLQGATAERARAAARSIAARASVADASRGPELAAGDAGLALLHAELSRAFPGEAHEELASRALERTLGALAREEFPLSLFSGVIGIGWTLALLCPQEDAEDEDAGPLDELFLACLADESWTPSFDLSDGLAGMAVYALEGMPRTSASRILVLVVERLARAAVRFPAGIAWRSDPDWLPAELQSAFVGEWNLGVAHGVPGVIGALARVAVAEVPAPTRDLARELVRGGVGWLLCQERSGEDEGFPFATGRAAKGGAARSAWCYGDPGVAATLMLAGEALGEPSWRREAARIAIRAARRGADTAGVHDAWLCHGATGLGHVFHRLYRSSGEEELARAARAWFARGLSMLEGEAPGGVGWLDGAGGAALALLAATGDAGASWDRALLLSARPSEQRAPRSEGR
jgi:hypothetical protein